VIVASVFHRDGKPIRSYLDRTAARNLIRAGVPQHVVMRLCGWKTDAMFRRYAIVDERDLRSAVALLAARGTIGAQSTLKQTRDVG
jgi:hypothetical protein